MRTCFRVGSLVVIALVVTLSLGAAPRPKPKPGTAQIYAQASDSEIVITVSERFAGAIDSLTYNGVEFIDKGDHGRQLQSASAFDCGQPNFSSELYNPTEAGSSFDGIGPTSTSRLMGIGITPDHRELLTINQMAFWLRPGEQSNGRLAFNKQALSDHMLTKHVILGYKGNPHVIDYRVTFTVPKNEFHTLAQFEALTGYMPDRFSRFWIYDHETRGLKPLDDGPGEQNYPVVFSTPTGSHAMGIYSPQLPLPSETALGYGRWRFPTAQVVKWNCVFRVQEPNGVAAGDYSYRMFVPVGNLAEVAIALAALHDEFRK